MAFALVLGLLHGPSMALPAAPDTAMAAPCHEAATDDHPAGKAKELPDCCPDGCDGGCTLAATDAVAGEVPAPPVPVSAPIALPPRALASGPPDSAFHPPRSIA
jgi:hypothetical protein